MQKLFPIHEDCNWPIQSQQPPDNTNKYSAVTSTCSGRRRRITSEGATCRGHMQTWKSSARRETCMQTSISSQFSQSANSVKNLIKQKITHWSSYSNIYVLHSAKSMSWLIQRSTSSVSEPTQAMFSRAIMFNEHSIIMCMALIKSHWRHAPCAWLIKNGLLCHVRVTVGSPSRWNHLAPLLHDNLIIWWNGNTGANGFVATHYQTHSVCPSICHWTWHMGTG